MKFLAPLFLLLPSLALAQPPAGQGQPPSFEEFKKGMQPVIEQSLPSMEKSRACINKAASMDDVETCMKEMAARMEALQKQLGMPGGGPGQAEMSKPPADFEWNAENKANMLKHMDQTISMNKAMLECLQSSASADDMNNCMRNKMSAP